MYLTAGMVFSKSFSKGQLVVSADNIVLVTLRFFATSGKKENSQVEQNLLLMNRKEKQNLGSF